MAKPQYSDLDLKKNEIKNPVIHRVSAFPANARAGQFIFHISLKAIFVCKDDSGDTTLKGAWGVGEIAYTELTHAGTANQVLVSNASNKFDLTDVDGGTF